MLSKVLLIAVLLHFGRCAYRPLPQETGLKADDKQYLLNKHNFFRSKVALGESYNLAAGQGASNMNRLVWSDELASTAQKHADDCTGPAHDHESNRMVGTFKTVGQNMMDCSRNGDCCTEAMDGFFLEGKAYYFEKTGDAECNEAATEGKTCGHYLQVSWAKTSYVGCGYNKCTGKGPFARLVCNYGEAGVYVGQKPYIQGAACSACPSTRQFCLDGLCLSAHEKTLVPANLASKITCSADQGKCSANGGTFSPENCQCVCSGGKTGVHCEKECTDALGDRCGSYKPYCKSAGYEAYMAANCALTCDACGSDEDGNHPVDKTIVVNTEGDKELPGEGEQDCLKEKNGATYRGKWAFGYKGSTCVDWAKSSSYASKVANDPTAGHYCRNPDGDSYPPWCVIDAAPGYEYCNVPMC